MRVPKKSTGTYKNAHFFISILPAHPIFPPVPQSPVRLALPPVPLVSPVSPVPQSLVRLALPILPAFSAFSEKISIPSLYFRYRKDTGSSKDYRKMSEVQTSNCRLKTRKISYANPIHNLFQISCHVLKMVYSYFVSLIYVFYFLS